MPRAAQNSHSTTDRREVNIHLVKDCSKVSISFSEHLYLSLLLSVEASFESSTILVINQYLSNERSLSVIAHLAMHSQEGVQEDKS